MKGLEEMGVYHNVESAAKLLNLNENTFTRYYLDFEDMGRTFKRSQDNKLLFSESDIELFKEFLVLKNQPRMTKKKAIEQLITTPETVINVKAQELSSLINMFKNGFEELKFHSTQSMKELKELKEHLQEFKMIQGRLEEFEKQKINDRDKLLMDSLRETQERKQIEQERKQLELENKKELEEIKKMLVAQQEVAASKSSKKKSWFSNFFRKE